MSRALGPFETLKARLEGQQGSRLTKAPYRSFRLQATKWEVKSMIYVGANVHKRACRAAIVNDEG